MDNGADIIITRTNKDLRTSKILIVIGEYISK